MAESATWTNERIVWMLGSLFAVSLPFVAVEYVPSTDLPQHAAQIRLLEALWGLSSVSEDTALLEARPFAPNTLVYWPFFFLARIVSLRLAGKLTIFLFLAGAVVALHNLARERTRDPQHALVASMLLFSPALYWGFLNFLSGLPLWLLFLTWELRGEAFRYGIKQQLRDAVMMCVLGWAHVFWVVVAGLTVVVAAVAEPRPRLRRLVRRGVTFVPIALAVAIWVLRLAEARQAAGFSLASFYLVPLADRFDFRWLVESLFGGIRGWLEPAYTAAIALYVAVVVSLRKRSPDASTDRVPLYLGLLLLSFVLLAPDQYLNTILLNRRFLPIAATVLLVSLPAAPFRALRISTSVAVGVFSVFTTLGWSLFDQDDLSGLRESLTAIPNRASVLGLDYRQTSFYVRNRPFLQIAAYAQAEHGGALGFSFAEHGSSIVRYRDTRVLSWQPGLEWLPDRATKRDVDAFDCALVNGDEPTHQRFRQMSGRTTHITEGYWRSYCRP